MIELTVGKYRGLQQCSTRRGTIAVMALDHRNNLRNALNPQAPQTVRDQDLSEFKQLTVSALSSAASAVLLDPEFGAAQCISTGALSGQTGLVVAVEATGYTGDPTARQSRVLPDWNVAKARRMGANAIKFLVYYHPDSPSAPIIEDFVRKVAGDCKQEDIPLFLEPLSYSLDSSRKTLDPDERHRVVLETARRLVMPGVDVLKAEFPLDIAAEPDEKEWQQACVKLSQACPVPWVLLSASVDYDTYLRQVIAACQAGASGVAAGRAVWKEATSLSGVARHEFLATTAYQRMCRLTSLCDSLGRPWTDFYCVPEIGAMWYAGY